MIIEEETEPEPELINSEIVVESLVETKPSIPEWVNTTTLWWSTGDITDDAFIQAIQFLIQEKILELPPTDSEAESVTSSTIPDWIRNTGSWWASGAISDDEFLKAIQFLVKNNIIVV